MTKNGATSDNKWYNEWKQMTASESEWQQMAINDTKWQWVVQQMKANESK